MSVFQYNLLILFQLLALPLFSQISSKGIPFVKNYPPSEYNAKNDNWAAIQDSRGVMYFGNKGGILEFDGHNWKNIAPGVALLAMVKDKNGVIFGGGMDDAGYLDYQPDGSTKFVSIIDRKNNKDTFYGSFHFVFEKSDTVYFFSHRGYILKWSNNQIQQLHFPNIRFVASLIKDIIYVNSDKGLGVFDGGSIAVLPGGEALRDLRVRHLFPLNDDSILVVTRTEGLFIFSGAKLSPYKNPSNEFLIKNQVYRAHRFQDSLIAFGTVSSGVLITDLRGNPLKHVNRAGGLQSNDHCDIYTDNRQNVWSSLEFGVSCIFNNSPFTQINEQWNLPNAAIYSVLVRDNILYAGTAQGVYYVNLKTSDNLVDPKFTLIKGTEGRKAWVLDVVENDIICSSSNVGTFIIKNLKAQKISNFVPKEMVTFRENFQFATIENSGFGIFEKRQGKWSLKKLFDNFPNLINPTADKNGNIWINDNDLRIIRLTLNTSCDSIESMVTFDSLPGLKSLKKANVFLLNNTIKIGTGSGTYEVVGNQILPDVKLNKALGHNFHVHTVKTDKDGNTWLYGSKNNQDVIGKIGHDSSGNIVSLLFDTPLKRISDYLLFVFYPIDGENIIFGSSEKLILYNPTQSKVCNDNFSILLRSVEIIKPVDSLLFGGTFLVNGKPSIFQPESMKPVLPFDNNALRFRFSGIFYEGHEKMQYQHRLLGFSNEWSEWSGRAEKEFTYLPEGEYTFEVRARNVFGTESHVTFYSFNILSPWYRTMFAYFFYFIIFVVFVYSVVKISIRNVEKERIKLERMVTERTNEIVEQKEEIMMQNQSLLQQREEILAQNELLNQQKEEILCKSEDLELKNRQIVEQNKQITASIQYASTIQMALLSSKETINQIIPNNFIFYKPRDIVSGDFYWIKKIKNIIIIAVADCTGHGVPGAFMSMLGIAFLNEIVRKGEITQANHVLNEMRQQVKISLSQTGNHDDSRDGMDMGLVVIYEGQNRAEYAGANIPLWLFRKEGGKSKLIEFKPDAMPIGVYINEKESFTNHSFDVQPDDTIYLFSDGFADQFQKGTKQKYTKTRFKELITTIHSLPMEQQEQSLQAALETWAGSSEQIDDILVTGFGVGDLYETK
jgi:serine phosphatase RsbU (regulator of sigma subunit)